VSSADQKPHGRETVAILIEEARRQVLQVANPLFSPTRFPFTYHHDHIIGCFPGARLSRSDVAAMLAEWAVDQEPETYAWAAIKGALAGMTEQGVISCMPEGLLQEADNVLHGINFLLEDHIREKMEAKHAPSHRSW
jgi:hypothetical protein